jgi:hypothetical protein
MLCLAVTTGNGSMEVAPVKSYHPSFFLDGGAERNIHGRTNGRIDGERTKLETRLT